MASADVYEKIKTEYIKGASLKDLADKYGVSYGGLRNRKGKEKWDELRDKVMTKKQNAIVTAVTKKQVKKESSIQQCADGLVDLIGKYVATGELDPDSIAKLTRSLKDLREIKHDLTEYELREQSLRLSILEKQAKADEVKDSTVTVEFINMDWDKDK